MKIYYFTFGYGQKHENHYVIVHAPDHAEARAAMIVAYGIKWAFQYTAAQWVRDGVPQDVKYDLTLLQTITVSESVL